MKHFSIGLAVFTAVISALSLSLMAVHAKETIGLKGIDESYPYILLKPVVYWATEMPESLPKTGIALCGKSLDESRLTEASITVDSVALSNPKVNPSYEVNVTGCDLSMNEKPWFFIVDKTSALHAGAVTSLQKPRMLVYKGWNTFSFEPDAAIDLQDNTKRYDLNGQSYEMRFRQADAKGYDIVLSNGAEKQTILSHHDPLGVHAYAGVLWAGDLDGDAKLDLIMNHQESKNAMATILFLSSQAKQGELLAPAAKTVEPIL